MQAREVAVGGGLALTVLTGSTRGLRANSALLAGPTEAVLVDAQFLPAEAEAVATYVAATGRRLTTVYVTHGHPDHYVGVDTLRARFPGVRVVARPDVIDDIVTTWPAKRAFWSAEYPSELPASVGAPEPFDGAALTVDGHTLEVHAMGAAESAHDTVVYVPTLRALVAGDLVYHHDHAWLGERRATAWAALLERLERQFPDVAHVVPGHGEPGDATLFARTRAYLALFAAAVAEEGTRPAALARILAHYPDHHLRRFLDISLDRWFEP